MAASFESTRSRLSFHCAILCHPVEACSLMTCLLLLAAIAARQQASSRRLSGHVALRGTALLPLDFLLCVSSSLFM